MPPIGRKDTRHICQNFNNIFMKKFFTFASLLCVSMTVCAQSVKISGVVSDDMGPAAGATVMVKGSQTGTVTDMDGRYTINAEKGDILVFSYVGTKPQERKVDGNVIDVSLSSDVKNINELVVTAIGIKQEKKKLGYTTQQVGGEEIAAAGNLNPGAALQGEVAGLTVSIPSGMFQSPSFSLRGKTPLIVLDGVPIESDLFDLSSENIASVNVLKGTAASALYGARGRNGAIMITTKQAQKEGIEINFSTKNMIQAGYTAFPETQHEYGSGSKGKYAFWDGEGGGISDDDMQWGPKLDVGNMAPQWNSPIRDKVTGETIPWWGSVKGTKYDDQGRYERVPMPLVSHDNIGDFLETGFITNNTLSLSYMGKKARVYVLGQYAYQKGQAPTTSLQNGGLNMNASFNISDKLTLDALMNYNMVYSPNYPDYGYHPSNYIYNIVEWMGDDIDGKELEKHLWVPGMEGYRQASYNYAWYNNPYFAIKESKRIQRRNVFTGQLRLNYQILPELSAMGRVSMRSNRNLTENKIPKSYMNYSDSREGGYRVWNESQDNVDADILLTYTKSFMSDINLTVNAGSSVFYRRYRNDYASTDGLNTPGIYSLNNSTGNIITFDADNPLWGTRSEKEIRSVYGSVNIDLSKYAYLSATARNDWSSTIATGNNSYFYPSVAISSVISDYVKMPKFIDYLKVMASWATVSSDLEPYQIQQVYTKESNWGNTPTISYPSALVNYNIKPQKTTSWEVGLSTSFLGRVSLDFSYYRNIDTNQILDMLISQASGFDSRKINGNTYTTNGIELMASVKAIDLKDFKWDFDLNVSHSVRTLSEIYGGEEYFGNLKKGDRADAYYATVWQRDDQGRVIVDATGQPLEDPYARNVGHYEPNVRLGMQNKFKYKDFTLTVNLNAAIGGLIYSQLSPKLWWGGKHPNSTMYRDQEYANLDAEGNPTPVYIPNAVTVASGEVTYDVHGNVVSDTRVFKKFDKAVDWQSWCQNYPYRATVTDDMDKFFANTFSRTYLKIGQIALTYDFKKLLPQKSMVKGLTATLFCNNVALWSKAPWIDPDISGDTSDNDGSNDPTGRYVGLGINMTF